MSGTFPGELEAHGLWVMQNNKLIGQGDLKRTNHYPLSRVEGEVAFKPKKHITWQISNEYHSLGTLIYEHKEVIFSAQLYDLNSTKSQISKGFQIVINIRRKPK